MTCTCSRFVQGAATERAVVRGLLPVRKAWVACGPLARGPWTGCGLCFHRNTALLWWFGTERMAVNRWKKVNQLTPVAMRLYTPLKPRVYIDHLSPHSPQALVILVCLVSAGWCGVLTRLVGKPVGDHGFLVRHLCGTCRARVPVGQHTGRMIKDVVPGA